MTLPDLPGIIDADEVVQTATHLASLQLPDGMIPWFPGGHCDPWNHVESAMALDVAGRHEEARRAYRWLQDVQRPDGSWHNYYVAGGVEDAKLDTNVIAYLAAGLRHHVLITGDLEFAEELWPTVTKAIDFVLALQLPRGEVIWARHVDGTPWSYALLTGSSSICHSLRCAVAMAEELGDERPDWELAAVNLADAIAHHPDAFAPKHRWAMDWYYPVLAGVLTGAAAKEQLASKWDTFVMEGLGVRCVSNEPWVTAAETAECSMAHAAAGDLDAAERLLAWTRPHRCDDGGYLTGLVHPERTSFPEEERTSYTAAAIILAADTITGATPAGGLFLGEHLPAVTPADELDRD